MKAPAKVTVLVADDEPLARRTVLRLLQRDPEIEVVGETADGRATLAAVQEKSPMLVFLDIQMPGLTGVNLLAALKPEERPAVVFVTAYDEFAMRAFDLCAIDYLLKPFSDERFAKALARGKEQARWREQTGVHRQLQGLIDLTTRLRAKPAVPREPVVIRDGGETHMLRPEEIRWIEGESDYARVHGAKRTLFVRHTLAKFVERLPADLFVRIHKSTIVNVHCIRRMRPAMSGDWVLELDRGETVRASRSHRKALMSALPGLTPPGEEA